MRAARLSSPAGSRSVIRLALAFSVGGVVLAACAQTQTRQLTLPTQARTLDKRSPFLKAHMLDGTVYVLTDWSVEPDGETVSGRGDQLGVDRELLRSAQFRIPIDSVAIFETNVVGTSTSVYAMAIISVASLGVTAYCAANPKACFGSCPTFYVSDGERPRLQAEGFSASVAPSLEAWDIDALYRARATGREQEVVMRNEALETHVVRHVNLLAAPRSEKGRVFASQAGEFRQAEEIAAPVRCLAPEGDCLARLRGFDGIERYSPSDSSDLAAREIVEVQFASPNPAEIGLVIAARQTLLSTYLFYQALAYMGSSAGRWLAALERDDGLERQHSGAVGRILGGIEVFVQHSDEGWVPVGEINETGPLATDVRFVPLGRFGPGPLNVRLRLTRGLWRLDWIALVELGEPVVPLNLPPVAVRRDGVDDHRARVVLQDSTAVLMTLPGDEYTLVYRLPEQFANYELFLESRGYYLEWMRQAWLEEEDPVRAAMLFMDPEGALRSLAPEYKRVEPQMEDLFWRSRYVRP